jgi:mono/diheme cytochrome c family protein
MDLHRGESRMLKSWMTWAAVVVVAAVLQDAVAADTDAAKPAGARASQKQVERGRYVVMIGGCNDCHTDGYGARDGNVEQSQWLRGSGALGFSGPWGTTYAPNLRLTVGKFTESEWVKYGKTLKTRPPMPWFNVNAMSEDDLRAMYRFIKSLGPAGDPGQGYRPPGQDAPLPVVEWRLGAR